MHGESNKYEGFNNLIQMIKKIWEIAQYTRATPSSSLVFNINIFFAASLSIFFKGRMSFKKGGFGGKELTFLIKNSLTFCTCSKNRRLINYE